MYGNLYFDRDLGHLAIDWHDDAAPTATVTDIPPTEDPDGVTLDVSSSSDFSAYDDNFTFLKAPSDQDSSPTYLSEFILSADDAWSMSLDHGVVEVMHNGSPLDLTVI